MSTIKHSRSTKSNTQEETMSVIDELRGLGSTAAPAAESEAPVAETEKPAKAKSADVDLSVLRERAADALDKARAENPTTKASLPEGALSPEILAVINANTQSTIKAVLDQFVPVLQKLAAPSPKEQREIEQLEALKKRFERERDEMMAQDAENRANQKKLQDACTHRDQNEKSRICLIRNQPMSGGAPHGICPVCFKIIRPLRFEELPPNCRTKEEGESFIRDLAAQSVGYTHSREYVRDHGPAPLEALVQKLGVKLAAPDARGVYRSMIWPADPLYPRVVDLVQQGK